MKSYILQDLSLESIKQFAAEFTDEEVRASLKEDDDNRPFVFDLTEGGALVMYWNAFNGLMGVANDDSVLAYAQVEYLRRHGYPCFSSFDDIEEHAARHQWPRKSRDDV